MAYTFEGSKEEQDKIQQKLDLASDTNKYGGSYDYVTLKEIAGDPTASQAQRDDAINKINAKTRAGESAGQVDPFLTSANRLKDIQSGAMIGQQFIGDGSLGRLQEGRSSEIANLIAERQKAYDTAPTEGLNAKELQAYRDQAVTNINRTTETARRRLAGAQATQGVRGATAVNQQQAAINQGNTERTNFERDLFLKQREALQQDRAEQATRLTALESSVSAARANEEATLKFNLEQTAREKFGQLSTALSFAGLGSTERASQLAAASTEAAAQAAKAPSSGGLLSKLF